MTSQFEIERERLRRKLLALGIFNKRTNVYVDQIYRAFDGLLTSCKPYGNTEDERRLIEIKKIIKAIDDTVGS